MKRNIDEETIINEIMINFNIDEQTARERLKTVLNEIQVIQNAFQNKKIRIRNNPGFPILITRNIELNTYDIVVSDITNVEYIPFINEFIDSMIRISQDVKYTNVSDGIINNICKGKSKEIDIVEDIIAAPEKSITEQTPLDIIDGEVEFEDVKPFDEDKQQEYLDFLLGAEDEDNENDNNTNFKNENDNENDNINRIEQYGGNSNNSDSEDSEENNYEPRDVTGINLGHPNPFQECKNVTQLYL